MARLVPTREQRLWMYQTMVRSRCYELAIATAYLEGKQPYFNMANGPIPGEMHLSDGQEPCAVGLSAHLHADDYVACHHRSHAQAIAKGVDLRRMTAEIFGRTTGLAQGRGGHVHLFDPAVNFFSSGIIGQNMGPAVGAALARKMRGEAGIGIACIGEGAANQGAFHEALNLAAVWKLPFICLIEDNQWAVSVPKEKSTAVPRNDVRGHAYGIPGEYVPGNDPDLVFDAVGRAVARARAGDGPSLIEVATVRLVGHFTGDTEGYRPQQERDDRLDPIPMYRDRLIAERVMDSEHDAQIVRSAQLAVSDAFAFARSSDEPRGEMALDCVFV